MPAAVHEVVTETKMHPGSLKRLGIGWEVGVPSGWGTYGLALARGLVRRNIEPALFFVASALVNQPDPDLAPALAQHPHWNEAFRRGPVSTDFPLLHALGDELDFPQALRRLHGRP